MAFSVYEASAHPYAVALRVGCTRGGQNNREFEQPQPGRGAVCGDRPHGGQSMSRDRDAEFMAPVTREMLNQRRANFETQVRDTLRADTRRYGRLDSPSGGGGETTVLKLLVDTVSHLSQHMG